MGPAPEGAATFLQLQRPWAQGDKAEPSELQRFGATGVSPWRPRFSNWPRRSATCPVPIPAPAFPWATLDAVNALFLFCCHPRIVIATWRPCPFRFRRSCSWTAPWRTRTTTCTRTWLRTRPTWCSRRRPSDCRWPRWPRTRPPPPPSWLPPPPPRPPARTPASRISDWKPKSTRPPWGCDADASAPVAPPARRAPTPLALRAPLLLRRPLRTPGAQPLAARLIAPCPLQHLGLGGQDSARDLRSLKARPRGGCWPCSYPRA